MTFTPPSSLFAGGVLEVEVTGQPLAVADADATAALADVNETLGEVLAANTGQALTLALLTGQATDSDPTGLLAVDS